MIGPPIEPETCCSASGMSTGLIAASEGGLTQVGTDGGQKFLVENFFACQSPGRIMNSPSLCRLFVPDLVTMFNAGLEVQLNSEENEFESTVISWMALSGTVAIAVWRSHSSSLLALSSKTVVWWCLLTLVTKYVALTKRFSVLFVCRNAELRRGSVVTFRPRIGVSSICGPSSRRLICGSARTPSATP